DSRRHVGDDDVRLETDQLRGQRGQTLAPAQLIPPVDDEVLSLDVAEVTKPLAEGLRRERVGRIEIQQDTHARNPPRLLRPGGERRGDQASQGPEEDPSVHSEEVTPERPAWGLGSRQGARLAAVGRSFEGTCLPPTSWAGLDCLP